MKRYRVKNTVTWNLKPGMKIRLVFAPGSKPKLVRVLRIVHHYQFLARDLNWLERLVQSRKKLPPAVFGTYVEETW